MLGEVDDAVQEWSAEQRTQRRPRWQRVKVRLRAERRTDLMRWFLYLADAAAHGDIASMSSSLDEHGDFRAWITMHGTKEIPDDLPGEITVEHVREEPAVPTPLRETDPSDGVPLEPPDSGYATPPDGIEET